MSRVRSIPFFKLRLLPRKVLWTRPVYRNGSAKDTMDGLRPGWRRTGFSDFFKTGSINQLVEVYWPITPLFWGEKLLVTDL